MTKRILAIIGIIILIGLYALTLIAAFSDSPNYFNYLIASVAATIVIPILLWIGIMFFKGREENKKNQDENK